MEAYLDLMHLRPLLRRTRGSAAVRIGIIDGPVDLTHPTFRAARIRALHTAQQVACQTHESVACLHGTFVTGIVTGAREGAAPALCPACEVILRPILPETAAAPHAVPSSTPDMLAQAMTELIDVGVQVLNLSLGLVHTALKSYPALQAACDYAQHRGVLLVTAAGNQGVVGAVPLVRHPWVLPVVACNAQGRVSHLSNRSPSIGRRGVMAPGEDMTSAEPGGGYVRMSGTSVATPFVTGTLALLWSEFPQATAAEIKHALLTGAAPHRRTITPPLLHAEAAWQHLRALYGATQRVRSTTVMADAAQLEEPLIPSAATIEDASTSPVATVDTAALPPGPTQGKARPMTPHHALRHAGPPPRALITAQVGADTSCPTCSAAALGQEAAGAGGPVYALGAVKVRFPSLAIEKEYAQAMRGADTANLSEQQVQYNMLRQHRYLANQVCWVLTIEGIETYILIPKDPFMLEQFIEALAPVDQRLDVDVVIGDRGPVAPVEFCNGLTVPLVLVDQIYSFDRPGLIAAMPTPAGQEEETFRATARDLFDRIQQMADNTGEQDEHRALNYLAVRYARLYDHAVEMHARDFSLTALEVIPSRLSGIRKLVDVILAYRSRTTDVTEKYYIRVDVTEKFPFLERALAPFYDR